MAAEISPKAKWWLFVASLPIILYTLLPIGWIVSLSLKPSADIADRNYFPRDYTWSSYSYIFTGRGGDLFIPALFNSIGICLIATVVAVVLSAFCAYGIARLEFPGKKLVLNAALLTAFFPAISIVTPLFNLWRDIGLYNTWPGLIIPYLSLTLPLSIWTLTAFFRQIPWEMEQAAQVDGATSWQAFRKVVLPLAAPGVFTTAIIAFFTAWNDFVYATSLSSTPGKTGHFDGAQTVPAALSFFSGPSQFIPPTGYVAAASMVVTIPVVILVLIFQKRIVTGLTAGAVKG
ncbi:carbohydrate ABC transporter membrane protein 2, CUT1 family [Jatrophihabitans endophyticus]|uniref:Carbohydrate ABC transporter membrane protein 2, CUT1 family n=1 Tax=Jatrophihabitans endophyticus TaxID=1206085 RepID=A0A1M5DKR0_9ACTN|nr:carbohydrate ABC transporter permease [Jatrophihabitans endophyticus]SHF67589.1 carbohydrate ABC transporter membrane protein 2, CUT1 family [Jatrophihabitans endophyticus]